MPGVLWSTKTNYIGSAILIWVAHAATGAAVASGPKLLHVMSESGVLLQLGSMVMPMIRFSTGVIGIMLL